MTRKPMVIVVLAASIQTAIADEATDAVQVLSKLWTAKLDANNQFVSEGKTYKAANAFVGDEKTYKMRKVYRSDDGTIEDITDEAPFNSLKRTQCLSFSLCILHHP